MTQALQLLTVVAVAYGLACYGLIKGRKEYLEKREADSRQASFAFGRSTEEHDKPILNVR